MRPNIQNRRGTALVITVALLAILAVIGFGFAVLARLHYDISSAYRASAQSDLIAQAALQYAIGEIRYGWANAPEKHYDGTLVEPGPSTKSFATFQTGAAADPTDSPSDPWFVDARVGAYGYRYKVGAVPYTRYCNLRCNSHALIHDELGARVGVSNIKVLDSAGKLNLNDYEGTLDTPNDARLLSVLTKLLEELGLETNLATAIIAPASGSGSGRNNLPNKQFTSLEDLRTKVLDSSNPPKPVIDASTYEILKHYVTVYSWPHELPVVNGSFPYVVNTTGSGSAMALKREGSSGSSSPKKLYCRSPININTAGRALLAANFRNVATADGTGSLSPTEARNVAIWITRKRQPLCDGEPWIDGGGTYWSTWVEQKVFDNVLKRDGDAVLGWSSYPLGPFDTWGEVMDFFHSLATRNPAYPYSPNKATSNPFPDDVLSTAKKAEALIAAVSPNVYAAGATSSPITYPLAGYNAFHLGISRLSRKLDTKDSATTYLEQLLRDKDTASGTLALQVTDPRQMATTCYTYPFCFSSMGRFEYYARTYTFLKAEQGKVGSGTTEYTLTDGTGKTWLSSPSQWRGYSVIIYEGKGKGQMRGIAYVQPFTSGGTTGNTLVVDRWSTTPDTTSRYYIVGPGPFLDRVPAGTGGGTIAAAKDPVPNYCLQDSNATWEDDQWNGHRVIIYRSTVLGSKETIDDVSIQERTIVDTIKGSPGSLIVAPDLDPNLMDFSTTGKTTSYIILGCDGVVERSAAMKAYDVIHHTTQDDFETGRTGTVGGAATGPSRYRKADGTVVGLPASRIDGWITAGRPEATAPTTVTGPMLLNFKNLLLAPDSGGTLIGASPTAATIDAADPLGSTDGLLLSDGLHLVGGSTKYAEYRTTADLFSDVSKEGGFVSFWFRPDEAFFTGDHTLLKIIGETAGQEEIVLKTISGYLSLVVTAKNRDYEVTIADAKHPLPVPKVTYKGGSRNAYKDPDASVPYPYASIAGWKPGEWHHIAFAWYENANDLDAHNLEPMGNYNTDGPINTDWRDDKMEAGGPPFNRPNGILDDEVTCVLRTWVDGKSSSLQNDWDGSYPQAFNFYQPAAGAAVLRLSGDACGTIDGLVLGKHTDKTLNFPADTTYLTTNLGTTPREKLRYDVGANIAAPEYAEYQSPTITISNPGGDTLTLGTIAWTGFFPWMKEASRWGGGTTPPKFPIQAQVTFDATSSKTIPENNYSTPNVPAIFNGGALLHSSGKAITATGSPTLQYKLYLYPYHGAELADNLPGLLKGRQTPVVEDVTVTYFGPVTFYYWK